MLHQFTSTPGTRRKTKRVGRGNSAGGGTTAGRGTKGQQARTGKGRKFGFEGGQVPLLMRQPKLGGFTRPRRKDFEPVNVGFLEERLEAGTYSIGDLRKERIVRGSSPVKLLASGALKKAFHLTVNAASKSAKEAVTKAGGSVTIVKPI